MNSEQMINSIYNPKRKVKQSFVFPKIAKAESSQPDNKVFVRGASKYNQQNIFKIDDEKKPKIKLRIEQERLRDFKNKQYEQLEAKMADMIRRHHEQMRQIEQNEKRIASEIENAKKEQYQVKLNIWELKNQVMELNSLAVEEENEYQRLYDAVGYQDEEEGDYEQGQEEPEIIDGQNRQEGGEEAEELNEEQLNQENILGQKGQENKAQSAAESQLQILSERQFHHECQSSL